MRGRVPGRMGGPAGPRCTDLMLLQVDCGAAAQLWLQGAGWTHVSQPDQAGAQVGWGVGGHTQPGGRSNGSVPGWSACCGRARQQLVAAGHTWSEPEVAGQAHKPATVSGGAAVDGSQPGQRAVPVMGTSAGQPAQRSGRLLSTTAGLLSEQEDGMCASLLSGCRLSICVSIRSSFCCVTAH